MRRVGEGKSAAAAVLEQDVDVLSGEKLHPLAWRRLEIEAAHVMGELFDADDSRRQPPRRNVRDPFELLRLDHEIGGRPCLTEQGLTADSGGLAKRGWRAVRIFDFAAYSGQALLCQARPR